MSIPTPPRQASLSARLVAVVLEGLKLLGIALGCLLVFAAVFAISVKTGIAIPKRWFGLCLWTGFLIWIICRQFKQHLRQVKFWITFLSLLVIHMFAFVVVLQRYPEWGLGWFMPIVVIEVPCMALALEVAILRK